MNTFVAIAVIFILACIFVASVIGNNHSHCGVPLYENAPPPPAKEPRRFYVKVSGNYLIDYYIKADYDEYGYISSKHFNHTWSTKRDLAIMVDDFEYKSLKASLPNNHTLELVIND